MADRSPIGTLHDWAVVFATLGLFAAAGVPGLLLSHLRSSCPNRKA